MRSAIWDLREQFVYEPLNVETVIHEAMLNDGAVTILDAGDDPAAGASGEGTGLLWALIDLGAPDATLGVVVDPQAVERSIRAGIGSTVTLDIGGAIDRRAGYPISVSARIRRVSDGRLAPEGGCPVELGRTAVLDVEGRHGGRIDVIVSERAPHVIEPELFAALGVDLSSKRIIAVKSSGQTRSLFEAITSRVLETSTPGITTPVLTYLEFSRALRPIFPLDAM